MNKNETIYDTVQRQSNKPYNVKNVTRLILLIRKGTKKELCNQYKIDLFVAMSRAVVKAVNNFFSICKKYNVPDEKIMHDQDDITTECFLVLENSLKNVNLKYCKMFYFYFNSALNRAMFRLYKGTYQKYANTIVNTEDNEKYIMDKLQSRNNHIDCTSIDLAGFSKIEMDIIEHKMRNDKLKDFLKKHDLPANQYYTYLDGIQSKLFELYKDPETNKLVY